MLLAISSEPNKELPPTGEAPPSRLNSGVRRGRVEEVAGRSLGGDASTPREWPSHPGRACGSAAPSRRRRLAIVALSWHLECMTIELSFDYRRLSVAQRLELVEDIWDSIDADADAEMLPLTDDERAMLDERVAELEANPGQGESWPEVRARILGRTR